MQRAQNITKLYIHIAIIIVALIFGFIVIKKGIKFDLFKKDDKPVEKEVIKTEVSNEYLENQLLQDWKDKVLNVDEYFKNLLFAEYDKEYLSDRYYPLKRSELPLDTDFIASTYTNKITDVTMNYYLNRVLLTGVTFDINAENQEEKKDDVIAFADTVYASDFTKKINLNRLVVSGNGNFVIWYTTTGGSAITIDQARAIANELEIARYAYDKMYNRYFTFKADFKNEGTIRESQLRVYEANGVDPSYLDNAMQVYVANYTETAAAKYVVANKLTEIYDRLQFGSVEGSIPGPYLLIRASSYNTSKERTMQIANRELFRHYQYNVYCPDETCLINDDPYYFDAMASYASAVATKKTTFKGFLNEWSAFAREHSTSLLDEENINRYGIKNISNALYLYLYFYANNVPDGAKRIVEALYKEKPFEVLEKQAGDYKVQLIKKLAMEYINQNNGNANIIASPEVDSNIKAMDSFSGSANVEKKEIEKIGIDYYVLQKGNNANYTIEFARGNENLACLLVGVSGQSYTLLAESPVGSVNVQFNTENYVSYDKYYIVVANSSIISTNVYSLDIKTK